MVGLSWLGDRGWEVRWGVMKLRVHHGVFRGFGRPDDRPVQAAPVAGHRRHSHRPSSVARTRGFTWRCSARARRRKVPHLLGFPNGIPSHDTFGDVFSRLDPDRFQECFMEWSQAVADLLPGEVVAIDGKTVRRSHDNRAGKQPIPGQRLGLGQHPDPGTGEDGGEIQRNTAIPRLLDCWSCMGA